MEERVQQWLALDRFTPNHRDEVEGLWKANDTAALEKILGNRMEFGTAGLRSRMGPGYGQMNMVTIVQTTQGFAEYILSQDSNSVEKGVCIGYDGRHNSKAFAHAAAAVFLAKKFKKVLLFDRMVITPMVPHTVVREGCSAGIMVTASHNPKADNGYKVYWNNGCQIQPPLDEYITEKILQNLDICITQADVDSVTCLTDTDSRIKNYVDLTVSTLKADMPKDVLNVTYTAMHGVGFKFVEQMFEAFGLNKVIPVVEQVHPDPEFPTVVLPNPEEGKGALKLAMETAERNGSNLIVANDPDADRLAIAERNPKTGAWHIFKGDEIGVLLACWRLKKFVEAHPEEKDKVAFLATVVSSKMLGAVAEKENLQFHTTPTGFKYLGNRALTLEATGLHVIIAYEEAIGFMLSTKVPDKDGVSAAAVFVQMANYIHSQNQTIVEHLDLLRQQYGYFGTNNSYYFCYDKDTIANIFKRLRADGNYATSCAGYGIKSILDATLGVDTSTEDRKTDFPKQSGEMIMYKFENGCVMTLRTSGTEPKIKYYCELSSHISAEDAAQKLAEMVPAVINEMLQPEKNQLKSPSA